MTESKRNAVGLFLTDSEKDMVTRIMETDKLGEMTPEQYVQYVSIQDTQGQPAADAYRAQFRTSSITRAHHLYSVLLGREPQRGVYTRNRATTYAFAANAIHAIGLLAIELSEGPPLTHEVINAAKERIRNERVNSPDDDLPFMTPAMEKKEIQKLPNYQREAYFKFKEENKKNWRLSEQQALRKSFKQAVEEALTPQQRIAKQIEDGKLRRAKQAEESARDAAIAAKKVELEAKIKAREAALTNGVHPDDGEAEHRTPSPHSPNTRPLRVSAARVSAPVETVQETSKRVITLENWTEADAIADAIANQPRNGGKPGEYVHRVSPGQSYVSPAAAKAAEEKRKLHERLAQEREEKLTQAPVHVPVPVPTTTQPDNRSPERKEYDRIDAMNWEDGSVSSEEKDTYFAFMDAHSLDNLTPKERYKRYKSLESMPGALHAQARYYMMYYEKTYTKAAKPSAKKKAARK